MEALQIIFFSLGIIAICVYLYKSFQSKPVQVKEEPLYGPVPTMEERRANIEWFIGFFREFPESGLKHDYPKQHKIAMALLIIDKINLQLQRGEITQEQYDAEYEKASELIDISEDIV